MPRAAAVAAQLGFAAAAGLGVYLLTCLWLPPAAAPSGFGLEWQQLSQHPFALPGKLPHRLLAPLLAWLSGLGGAHWLLFSRGLSVLLLAVVFQFCRHRGSGAVDALLVTVAVGISGAVQMYKQFWPGYVDDLGYALFLLAAMAVRRPVLFWALWLANLCNHELAVFLLPWSWWLRRRADAPLRQDLIGAPLALALYGAFYLYVHAHAPAQEYDARFFAEHPLFPWATLWLWILALAQWLNAYGPLLMLLAWHQHAARYRGERLGLWLVVAAVLAIFAVAFDVARHTNLLVLPMVFAAQRCLAAGHRGAVTGVVAAAAAMFWLLPPWQQASWPMHYFVAATLHSGAYTDFQRVLTHLLPATWSTVLLVIALLALLWVAGWWLARRSRDGAAR